jgi:hypothetical protein
MVSGLRQRIAMRNAFQAWCERMYIIVASLFALASLSDSTLRLPVSGVEDRIATRNAYPVDVIGCP